MGHRESPRDCPWFRPYRAAAYAAEGVLGILGLGPGFGSMDARRLFVARRGLAVSMPLDQKLESGNDAKFLAAVLSKLAGRGSPVPCSLSVERHVLAAAQQAGILKFSETSETGEYRFSCQPSLARLPDMLLACLLPELLLADRQVQLLLTKYREVCTKSESEFFDRLLPLLSDPRLGLLVIPQRLLRTMVSTIGSGVGTADRVDFTVETVSLLKPDNIKVAIELDDPSHQGAQGKIDEERDRLLKKEEWKIFRLRTAADQEKGLNEIAGVLNNAVPDRICAAAGALRDLPKEKRRAVANLILLPVAEAQITALAADCLRRFGHCAIRVEDPQQVGLQCVIDAVNETIASFRHLHGLSVNGELALGSDAPSAIHLNYRIHPDAEAWGEPQNGLAGCPVIVGAHHVDSLLPASPRAAEPPAAQSQDLVGRSLLHALNNWFRKVEFRQGQKDIILRALSLRPTVGLLPTAAGKSLCYQLASLAQPGCTLVVDPLRSLMLDQKHNMEALGIHRCLVLMSGQEATEADDRLLREKGYTSVEQGHQLFVLVAPERLQMPQFRARMKSFAASVAIPYCVVDEAHCVSEWGHDFRPSYLNIGRMIHAYCEYGGAEPTLFALTGTASRNVLIDIMRELRIEDQSAVVEPSSFDRPELKFEFIQVRSEDRMLAINGKLRELLTSFGWTPEQPAEVPSGLVFSFFVNDAELGIPRLAAELKNKLGLNTDIYSGTPPKDFPGEKLAWEQKKIDVQARFTRDELPILVCTHGFGMGIDKPNIRFIAHAMLPRSLEEFYQQAGRAGRDRREARCLVFFSDDQPLLADELLDTGRTTLEEIQEKAGRATRRSQGDAIRNTWFLTNNFLGREKEQAILVHVLNKIVLASWDGEKTERVLIDAPFNALPDALIGTNQFTDRAAALEKALYRLLMVGAIYDYTKNYSAKKFEIELRGILPHVIYDSLRAYLMRYSTEGEAAEYMPRDTATDFRKATVHCGKSLIEFIYATVEARRRRAIGQMLQAARDGFKLGGAAFREQLLAYLEESEFTKPIMEIATRLNPLEWTDVIDGLSGADGITKLLGACRRQLEETPNHPGLLILGGLCLAAGQSTQDGLRDLENGFVELSRQVKAPMTRAQFAEGFIEAIQRLIPSKADAVISRILSADSSTEVGRVCYKLAPENGDAHFHSTFRIARSLQTMLIKPKE